MVRRHGDCTTCMERGHDTDAQMEEKQNEATTCGPYIKATGTACIQNAVFHGPASHNARNRSKNSQRRGITQLAFIIALGLLLKGIQVIEAAQWQPDKYYGNTGLPLGFKHEGIETNKPQIKDQIGSLSGPLSGTITPDEKQGQLWALLTTQRQTSGMTGGEETPRARMSLSQQEGKKDDRNLEEYYSCRQTAIRNKIEIKELPKKVVGTPTSHQTSRKRQETESGKLRSIKFTTEKHELCHKEMGTAISKGEYWNGQYRSPFPESGSYKAEEHSRIWQEIWGRSHQDSLYRQTPRIVKVIVRGSIDKERYNQLKWEWIEVETRHLNSVDELERGT